MVHIGLKCKQTKNIKMKQLLSLFLLLLPCLAWAQYPSNGNQKITLGEQTTADGLIYRGVASTDTVRKPSIDTMAYMVLDTTTNIIWHYKKATSNAWLRLNLLPSDTASMLTNYWRSGRFSGTLPVANGGTNASTFTAGSVVFAGSSGTYTQDNGNLFFDNTNDRLGIGTNNPISKLDISLSSIRKFLVNFDDNIITMKGAAANGNPESIRFVGDGVRFHSGGTGSGTEIMRISSSNKVGILTNDPTEVLHVVGNARITAMNGIGDIGADANGVLQAATSDMNLKNTIENSPFGLNEILLLNPVTFLYNDTDRKIDSDVKEVGFIAQDVFDIIPNAVSSTGIGYLQLDYRAITATLVKAIQEQNAIIKALEQRIINLENK
jgi:hypothetical protein